MKIEIAIEGPVQAMSELLGRLARMSPTLERFRDPFEGDEEKARVLILADYGVFDDTLMEISRVVREVERALGLEKDLELRTRNLAYSEPPVGGGPSGEPFRAVASMTIVPWHPSLARGIDEAAVVIDPHHAFGTGKHPTTHLCLESLERMARSERPGPGLKGKRVLDFGCGTGLLAIAAVKMGAGTALGIEIDPQSARTAERNVALNGLQGRVMIRCGSWDAVREKFDLILANVVASVLLRTGRQISGHLQDRGEAVVSGFSENQVEEIKRFLVTTGLILKDHSCRGGWAALAFTKKN
jgi:SAM-dependent methyltransferase